MISSSMYKINQYERHEIKNIVGLNLKPET